MTTSAPAGAAGRVTRDVDPAAVRDLVSDPPRASVAFVDGDRIALAPALARGAGERHLFGVVPATAPDLAGREVVLLIDDGPYWFALRGLSVRGVASAIDPPAGEPRSLAWYEVTPRRVLAWDYSTIREE
jgi:hypothetical protein